MKASQESGFRSQDSGKNNYALFCISNPVLLF
jgi:hypothetical protein